MDKSDALRHVLQDISVAFNEENERYDVELTNGYSGINEDGEVAVNTAVDQYVDEDVTGANELRLLVDDMAYHIWRDEVDHRSNVEGFMEERREAPHLAGVIRRLIERQYLNATRVDKYRGLKKTLAFRNDLLMANETRVPPADLVSNSIEAAYVESLVQLSLSGYVKDFERIEDEQLRSFIVWVRERLAEARVADEAEERDALADEVYAYMLEQADKKGLERSARSSPIPIEQLPSVSPRWSDVRFRLRRGYELSKARIGGAYTKLQELLNGYYGDVASDETEDRDGGRSWDRIESFAEKVASLPVIRHILSGVKLVMGVLIAILVKIYRGLGLDRFFGWLRRLFMRLSDLFPDLFTLPFGSGDGDDDEEAKDSGGDSEAETTLDDVDVEDLVLVSDDSDIDEDSVEQMELMEERSRAGDWFNLDSDIDYRKADASFEERYEALNNDSLHVVPPIEELEDVRDSRIKKKPDKADRFSAEIQARLSETDLDREIEEAFRQLTTRDRNVRSRRGRKLDMHAVQRRVSGDKNVDRLYTKRKRAEVGRRAVVVALDASGSMDMSEANLAIKALQHATEAVGDEFLAVSFNGNSVNLITAPNEEHDDRHLAAVGSGGGTPVARGVIGARKLLRDATYREALMIVITDGRPNKSLPKRVSTGDSVDDVAEEVHKARRDGIPVVGLAAGGDIKDEMMVEMFGEGNVVHADMDDLANQLVDIYKDQMRFAQ